MMRKKSTKVNKPPKKSNKKSNSEKDFASNAKVFKCSRRNLAIKLLKEKAKEKKPRKCHIAKCKTKDSGRVGILPYYQPHILIQIRNALVTHNWEAAALFLRLILKIPIYTLYKFIWRAFFLIVQHVPEDCSTRMDRFQRMCSKVLKVDDFLMALSIPEEKIPMEED